MNNCTFINNKSLFYPESSSLYFENCNIYIEFIYINTFLSNYNIIYILFINLFYLFILFIYLFIYLFFFIFFFFLKGYFNNIEKDSDANTQIVLYYSTKLSKLLSFKNCFFENIKIQSKIPLIDCKGLILE